MKAKRKLDLQEPERLQKTGHIIQILRWRKENISVCLLCWIYLSLFSSTEAQLTERKFPPSLDLAVDKNIYSTPSAIECGTPSPTAYCQSAVLTSSITSCKQAYCENACPERTTLPLSTSLLIGARDYGLCVTEDRFNIHPLSSTGSWSAAFLNVNPRCNLTPRTVPSLGLNGALTLSFWIWLDTDTLG